MSAPATPATRAGPAPTAPDLRDRLHALAPSSAKLRPPPVRAGLVPRPSLVDRVRAGEPVVVVSAPAGYGKTTLLAQWAQAEDRPVAWLTLTEGDNDLTTLVAYLVRTLDEVEPLPPEALAAFVAAAADGPTVLLPRLGRMLLDRRRPFVLALDDVHVLADPDSLSALGVLVSHLPEGSQLALATRQDPPLARARLRAGRTLMEVRADDLALTREEGTAALRDAGVEVDDETAASLVARTEGWAAGIYLAALAVRGLPDAIGAARRFAGDHRLVAEYLRDELIEGLPDDVVEFLTRTSVLEYLDGPGCDAVLEGTDSWAILEELAHSNLFVIPLDHAGEQYRYHHLFADLLLAELRRRDPGSEAELHRRASELFVTRGHPDLAIRHAQAAGEVERAADLVWLHVVAYVGTGRGATVERWLAGFSPEEVAARPSLLVASAWCAIANRAPRSIANWLDLAASFDPDIELADGVRLGAMVALLDAVGGQRGIRATFESAERAAGLTAPGSPYWFLARYIEGTGLMLLGRADEARERLADAVGGLMVIPGTAAGALSQLALLAAGCGDWDEAQDRAERALALIHEHHLEELPIQVATFAALALIEAHRGHPQRARRHSNRARRLASLVPHQVGPWLGAEARIVLARVELLLGDVEAARVLAREARDFTGRMPDAGIFPERLVDLFAAVESSARTDAALGLTPLTTAELRVLAYLPTHLSFQAMAEDLFVSRNTVKTQAISIYRKLGVSSRGDAVDRARDLGLLES